MSKRVLISIGIAVIAVIAAFLFFKMDLTKQEDPDDLLLDDDADPEPRPRKEKKNPRPQEPGKEEPVNVTLTDSQEVKNNPE